MTSFASCLASCAEIREVFAGKYSTSSSDLLEGGSFELMQGMRSSHSLLFFSFLLRMHREFPLLEV